MDIEINKKFHFYHVPTFGWSLTVLSFWIIKRRKYYTEKRNVELFYCGYFPRAGGIDKDGMYWTGTQYYLNFLFFIRLTYNHVTSRRELTAEDFE